jgi:hypothetical protein
MMAREEVVRAASVYLAEVAELRQALEQLRERARGLAAGWDRRDDSLRDAGHPVGWAAEQLASPLEDLAGAAAARLQAVIAVLGDPTRCGVPWPVCPHCPGVGLTSSGGDAWCPRCGRSWRAVEVEPCPWPIGATVTDQHGAQVRWCALHAASAAERLIGATVHYDDPGQGSA